MENFKINFLDHVAIRVKNLEVAAKWYEKVLGLKKHEVTAWGPYPIFMLAGKTGVALFPVDVNAPDAENTPSGIRIDHFAFNVSKEDFKKARDKYERLSIAYDFRDHTHFHSIYTKDPDGHTVELTTLVVPEADFYDAS